MFTAYIVVSIFTAAANSYAAIVDFRRPQWVVDNITKWGGSHSWLFPLGVLKAAGALGLLVGIGVPLIGVAAAVGLVLFFVENHQRTKARSGGVPSRRLGAGQVIANHSDNRLLDMHLRHRL